MMKMAAHDRWLSATGNVVACAVQSSIGLQLEAAAQTDRHSKESTGNPEKQTDWNIHMKQRSYLA